MNPGYGHYKNILHFNQDEMLKGNKINKLDSWIVDACKHRICGNKQINRSNEFVLAALRVLDKVGVRFSDHFTASKVKVDPQVEKTKRSSPIINNAKEDKSKNVEKG